MLRQRLFNDLDSVAQGHDPSALIRDVERAKFVDLPNANAHYHQAMTRAQWLSHPFIGRRAHGNPWVAGQPDGVRQEFLAAMGLQLK
jgi:hypothetical protein